MSIPTFEKDLRIIQALSDLPNAADGLSAAELKEKFDEAAIEIKNWLNDTLVPAISAENIPFTATEQLPVSTIASAIEFVYDQIAKASEGTIADSSVTKNKLAGALLDRVFGGRLWVSLDKPTENENPSSEFLVGQIWMRPGFTVQNFSTDKWSPVLNSCTVENTQGIVTVTGNKTSATASVVMDLSGIGQAGDRVYILCDAETTDSRVTALSVTVNNEEETAPGTVQNIVLAGTTASVKVSAKWNDFNLADGSFTINNMTVVNADHILRQLTDCRDMTDWGAYLQTIIPFVEYVSDREIYVQTSAGVWEQFDYEVFPVDRGGTGNRALNIGEMLCGSGTRKMDIVSAAEETNSVMQFIDGMPRWQTPDQMFTNLGALRIMTGEYTGDGAKDRTVTLPVEAKLVYLYVPGGSADEPNNGLSAEEPAVLANGAVWRQYFSTFDAKYNALVSLQGNTLTFSHDASGSQQSHATTALGNRNEVKYNYVAIY